MNMQNIYEILINPSVLISVAALKEDKQLFKYSFVFSAFAIFNWRVGSAVITGKSFNFFLFDLLLYIFLFLGFQIFYLPVIHFFAEQPDAQIKPFIAYFNFSTKILAALLPASMILYLVPGGLKSVLLFYGLSLSSIMYICYCALKGLKINYRISSFTAIFFMMLPSILFLLFLMAESALVLGIIFLVH